MSMKSSFRGKIKRGQIYIANLDPALGSEEKKQRRVLIVSNDRGNSLPGSPVVVAVPISSEVSGRRKNMPMFVPLLPDSTNGQTKEALIDCLQIRVLDIDERIISYVGTVDSLTMKKVNAAIETCLQLKECPKCTSVLLPNKKHCPACKEILIHICIDCCADFDNSYNYCPHCGNKKGGGK